MQFVEHGMECFAWLGKKATSTQHQMWGCSIGSCALMGRVLLHNVSQYSVFCKVCPISVKMGAWPITIHNFSLVPRHDFSNGPGNETSQISAV